MESAKDPASHPPYLWCPTPKPVCRQQGRYNVWGWEAVISPEREFNSDRRLSQVLDNHPCLPFSLSHQRRKACSPWEGQGVRCEPSVTEAITDVTERRAELEMRLQVEDGKAFFPALFDLSGNLLAARLVTTFRGTQWALLASDDPHSKVTGWFDPSRARSREVRLRHDAAKGFYVGCIRAFGKVDEVGSTPALVRVAIVRADAGFSRDVEVVDNGRERGIAKSTRES